MRLGGIVDTNMGHMAVGQWADQLQGHSLLLRLLYSLRLFRVLRRLFLSANELLRAAADGRCFLNGFDDILRKSSSDWVTDKSDKNDPVELISLPCSRKRFDFDFRLRVDVSRKANLLRVSSSMSRSPRKNSLTCASFLSYVRHGNDNQTKQLVTASFENGVCGRSADSNAMRITYKCIKIGFGRTPCFNFGVQHASGVEQLRFQLNAFLYALVELALQPLCFGHGCLPLGAAFLLYLKESSIFCKNNNKTLI